MAYLTNPVEFDSRASDAFGRGRIAEPQTLFDVSFEYDAQPLLMQTLITGSASASKTSNISAVTLSTSATISVNNSVDFQSKAYYRYEPGKGQLVTMTGILGAYKQYVRKMIGYFDAANGVFFDMDGTSQGATGVCAVTVRTSTSGSAVDVPVLQSSWNLDKMDGTGPSGVTLDFTKTQIFVIDLQWLGTGRVRFGFNVSGTLYYCHQILNANIVSVGPYMNTACLPLHWAVHNTGAVGTTTTLMAICGAIISEGGAEYPTALQFSTNNAGTSVTAANGTRTPILSIRPKTTFNSITNRSQILLIEFELLSGGATTGFWELVYNGTLGSGTSFSDVDATNSGVQKDVSSTTCTGGIVVASGYLIGGVKSDTVIPPPQLLSKIPFTLDALGTTPDIYSLCCTGIGSTVAISGAMCWTELR